MLLAIQFNSLLNALPGNIAQGLIWGILAIGVYMTFRLLDFADLTVDGSLATGGAVAVMLIRAGINPWLAVLGGFFAGVVCGLVTGILHTALGIPGILASILTQISLYSINLNIMGKSNQPVNSDKRALLASLGYVNVGGSAEKTAVPERYPLLSELGINVSAMNELQAGKLQRGLFFVGLILGVLLLIALCYWFFGTEIGHAIRATGCNERMAKAQGINTSSMKVLTLMISNGFFGLAGGLYAQYQGAADVNMGRGAIVIGLAAVIIGEVIFGRFCEKRKMAFAFTLLAVVIGAIIYYIVYAVVIWLKLPSEDMKLFSAVIVAIFLAIPYLKRKYSRKPVRSGNASAEKEA